MLFSAFIGAFLFAPFSVRAQTSPKLEFEVASVKPADPQKGSLIMRMTGGPGSRQPERIDYAGVTLKNLMMIAYDVKADQVSGPGWLDSERYDIQAPIPPGTTRDQFGVMLQNLVAKRFQLTLHREKKDFLVYQLVVAKGGPKLKLSAAGGTSPASGDGGRGGKADNNGFPLPPAHQTAQASRNGVAKLAGNQVSMTVLVQSLQFPLALIIGGPNTLPAPGAGARVVDKTGLTGEYDFTLEYLWPGQVARNSTGDAGPADGAGDPAPTLFTALQQQLGLKLEQVKEPFDVLIVDHAEKVPTEN